MPGPTCPRVSEGALHQRDTTSYQRRDSLVKRSWCKSRSLGSLHCPASLHCTGAQPRSQRTFRPGWGRTAAGPPAGPGVHLLTHARRRGPTGTMKPNSPQSRFTTPTARRVEVKQEKMWFGLLLVFAISFSNMEDSCEATAHIQSLRRACDLHLPDALLSPTQHRPPRVVSILALGLSFP